MTESEKIIAEYNAERARMAAEIEAAPSNLRPTLRQKRINYVSWFIRERRPYLESLIAKLK